MKNFRFPLQPPKVKREHFRRVMFLSIAAVVVAHFMHPDAELTIGMVCNFLFYYEPVITV
jgi:hypothetical protein